MIFENIKKISKLISFYRFPKNKTVDIFFKNFLKFVFDQKIAIKRNLFFYTTQLYGDTWHMV